MRREGIITTSVPDATRRGQEQPRKAQKKRKLSAWKHYELAQNRPNLTRSTLRAAQRGPEAAQRGPEEENKALGKGFVHLGAALAALGKESVHLEAAWLLK